MADEFASSASELKTLTYEAIKEFFDNHIKTYFPYSGSKVYDTIIDNLVEYYLNHGYNDIPADFKNLFETANVNNVELYNELLIAVGLPVNLINDLSVVDKVIFLKTLSDFQRYKSSLSFVEKLGESYSQFNKLNIYELYIDYDSTLQRPWVLKPVVIYKHDDVKLSLDSLDYETIYNQIPSLLLSVDQLNTLYADEKLVLPLKSNLLFLEYDLSRDVSILYDLIVTIFLIEYANNNIEIYFNDRSLLSSLKNIYYAWYYLMTRYYNMIWETVGVNFALRFIQTGSFGSFPYTINDIDILLKQYDEIDTISKRDSFYKTKFADVFANYDSIDETFDHSQMLAVLTVLDPDLAIYLDNRISAFADEELRKTEINLILTEIYSSLILYSETCGIGNFTKYSEYLLRFLPQIIVNPSDTSTYTILYNVKPFHVELYTRYREGILCRDKFNTAWVEDGSIYYAMLMGFAHVLILFDIMFFNYVYNYNSSLPILTSFTNRFTYCPIDIYDDITESWEFLTSLIAQSLISISSKIDQINLNFNYNTSLPIISNIKEFLFTLNLTDNNILQESMSFLLNYLRESVLSISSKYETTFDYSYNDIISIISDCYYLYSLLYSISVELGESQTYYKQFPGRSVLSVSCMSNFSPDFLSLGNDNVCVVDDYVVIY